VLHLLSRWHHSLRWDTWAANGQPGDEFSLVWKRRDSKQSRPSASYSAVRLTSWATWCRLMGSSHSLTSSPPFAIGQHRTVCEMFAHSMASQAITGNLSRTSQRLPNHCPGWRRKTRHSCGQPKPNSRLKNSRKPTELHHFMLNAN